jgi:hypothetical protein
MGSSVPDGAYADGRPFSTEFVGSKFSEPQPLGSTYALSQWSGYVGRLVNLSFGLCSRSERRDLRPWPLGLAVAPLKAATR